MVAGGEIYRAFDAQRKQNTIAGLKDHVIICGFSRMAQVMATHLAETEQKFVVIDNDKERIAIAESFCYLTQEGDATDENLLQADTFTFF